MRGRSVFLFAQMQQAWYVIIIYMLQDEMLTMIQGCDIPDVNIVVQWKVPENLSSWVQQAGHAAWGDGQQGLAVMIVKKSSFEIVTFPQPSAGHSTSSTTRGVGHGCVQGWGHGWGRGSALLGSVKAVEIWSMGKSGSRVELH